MFSSQLILSLNMQHRATKKIIIVVQNAQVIIETKVLPHAKTLHLCMHQAKHAAVSVLTFGFVIAY